MQYSNIFPEVLCHVGCDPQKGACLVLGHLLDQHLRHGPVRSLRHHVTQLGPYDHTVYLACPAPNVVALNISIDIFPNLHGTHIFVPFVEASAVAELVIAVLTPIPVVVPNNRTAGCHEGNRRANSLVRNHTALVFIDKSDSEHFRRCDFLDPCHIVLSKPLEVFGSQARHVHALDQDWHFPVPGLVHGSFPGRFIDYLGDFTSLGDEASRVVD